MKERLKQVIAVILGIDTSAVTEDASPATLKNWDSLKQMQIMLAVEEEFGVRFDDDQIHALASFRKISTAVGKAAKS